MASKRDLVEAHTFNRRRLVAAFVSGAPGGREVEPASPARPVVVSVVLAVLLVGGAALTGFLKPTLPSGWEDNTLVVGKDTGARYVSIDGTLYPVVNMASARLLVPQNELRVAVVPDEQLNSRPQGQPLGIIGAPESLPDPDVLLQDRWTSCVDQYGRTRLRISGDPKVNTTRRNSAYYARTDDGLVLITGGQRFPVANADRSKVLAALDLLESNPVDVPGRWVDLFPAGSDLEPITIPEAGLPVPSQLNLPAKVTALGSILQASTAGGRTGYYLVRRDGLVPLTEVALELYKIEAEPRLRNPVPVDRTVLARNKPLPRTSTYAPDWPEIAPQPLTESVVCALLRTGVPGMDIPTVSLVLPRGTLGATSTSDVVPDATEEVIVDPGRGALVQATSGGSNRGTVYLVDAKGRAYGTDGPHIVEQLGYKQVQPRSVPPSWVEFLESGPELSRAALVRSMAVLNGGAPQ